VSVTASVGLGTDDDIAFAHRHLSCWSHTDAAPEHTG
jgi:hypothetical protein